MTGAPPYHDLEDDEIELRYLKGELPDIAALGPIGRVIEQCWSHEYRNCDDMVEDIKCVIASCESSPS